ncbi:hypothetical protein [Halogranum rubrum]|uniref:Uncharacterized protein n=1 Tax=Halogranum salarium B-1 TaxID=1210908 RepID=J3EUY9_9EURY|nr:hypothetical protein [Halogranum salarium]EJN58302.1 hypothetical protein HSB1_37190 [Halogranum salarium B-1]
MTPDDRSPIRDEAVFREQLNRLLLRAHMGGITVSGGWPCENTDGNPSWDVEIFRLKRTRVDGISAANGEREVESEQTVDEREVDDE